MGVLLWEALAGEHPFWGGDLNETSRLIQQGAPPLESLRPDLQRHVLDTVAGALVASPQRRPSAERLADELRSLPKRRRKKGARSRRRPPGPPEVAALGARLLPGGLTGLASGWVAATLPFYPQHWPAGLAVLGFALGAAAPRIGLLFALTVAFFPLANISLGLAAVYAAIAVVWAVLNWRDARTGLLPALGPLLAPLAALTLVPLAAQLARGRVRRASRLPRSCSPPSSQASAGRRSLRRLHAAARPRDHRLRPAERRRARAHGTADRAPGAARRGAGARARRRRAAACANGRARGRLLVSPLCCLPRRPSSRLLRRYCRS